MCISVMLQISFLAFYANSLLYIHSLKNDYILDIVFLSYSRMGCCRCNLVKRKIILIWYLDVSPILNYIKFFNHICQSINEIDGIEISDLENMGIIRYSYQKLMKHKTIESPFHHIFMFVLTSYKIWNPSTTLFFYLL